MLGGLLVLIEQRNALKGEILVPGDKSISHRAILFGSIAKGVTEIDGLLMSEDSLYTIHCLRKMQVGIEILNNNKVRINGNGLYGLKSPASILNAGRSGTAARLLLGLLAGQPFNSILTREASAVKKPLGKVVKPLRQMGANITGKDNGSLCPLSITPAKLNGTDFNVDALDMYIKSPILISGLYAEGSTTVSENIKSRDHSELMMQYFGAEIEVDGLKISVSKTDNLYAQQVQIPGDISIAIYFITAGLLVPNSELTIRSVGINPTRSAILDIYKSMGAQIQLQNVRTISGEKVADICVKSSVLHSVNLEGDIIPSILDEIPVLAVAASAASGTSVVKDLKGFKIKESGRVREIYTELRKMGVSIQETDDGFIVEGGKPLRGTIVESYNDHLIAMSLSVAGLIADGETMLRKTQVIDLVFPEFYTILGRL